MFALAMDQRRLSLYMALAKRTTMAKIVRSQKQNNKLILQNDRFYECLP